ncbi:MAG: hypothetical protein U0T82_04060 [Bacteroidales bacterium]
MKNRIIEKLILFILVLVAAACSRSDQPKINLVHIQGVTDVYNLSKTHTYFGSYSLDDQLTGMALEDGDLLYVICGDESSDIFFRYHARQGEALTFKTDSLTPFRISLNDGLFSLNLSDSAAWEWLARTEDSGLDSLHSISLKLPVPEREIGLLQKLAKTRPDVNLMIEAKDQSDQCEQILSIFKPDWLYLTIDTSWTPGETTIENLKNLSLLGLEISQLTETGLSQLYRLQNIQQLIISWDPGKGPAIDFKKFNKLSSLTLKDSDIKSLNQMSIPEKIESLFLVECDSLTDIHAVSALNDLKVFGLSGCDILAEPGPLAGLKDSAWLSLPRPVKQHQFDSLLPQFKSLQVLEVLDCDSITDLTILGGLTRLKALSITSGPVNPMSLGGMDHLSLLVIKPDTGITGENQVRELRSQLPSTLVVPGKGFCLGSGWLLLLIPAVILGMLIMVFFKSVKTRVQN